MAEGINKYSSVAPKSLLQQHCFEALVFQKVGGEGSTAVPCTVLEEFLPASWVLFPKARELGMFLQRRRAESGRKNPDNPKSVSANWMGVIS